MNILTILHRNIKWRFHNTFTIIITILQPILWLVLYSAVAGQTMESTGIENYTAFIFPGPERKFFCIAIYASGSLYCNFTGRYIFIQWGTGGICIKCCILLQSHFYGVVSTIGIKRVFIGIVPTAQFAVMGAVQFYKSCV